MKIKDVSFFEGEIFILKSILRDVKKGFYLDIGANHPTRNNNTYIFYLKNWRGVAVDPLKKYMSSWHKIRPNDKFLNIALSNKKKKTDLFIFSDDTDSSIAKKYIRRCIYKKKKLISKKKIETTTISDILKSEKRNIKDIHLMSLDVEGEELKILQGFDFNLFKPGVIIVEDKNIAIERISNSKIYRLLYNYNYRLIAKTLLNSIYVNPAKKYLTWIPRKMYI